MSIQISKQQFDTRWDALPEILRAAMVSEANSGIVWKTAEGEHLINEKISVVSKLTGYVLMGFIHPEDLANEIKDSIGIDLRIATAIAEPINRKVLQPIREELDNVYAPPGDESRNPIPIEEIGKLQAVVPVSAQTPTSVPAPQISKQEIPVPVASVPVAKPAIRPSQLPQSMIQPRQQVKAVPPPNLPVSESPEIKPMEKTAAPAAEQPVSAPFILHQETESQPLAPAGSGFKVSLSEEQFGKMEQKWTPPPKAAQIETGFVPQVKPDSRVVHYSEMRTPVAPKPPVAGESAIPKPPAVSAPEYKISQPVQPRFPVSRPEKKMTSQPENPFGVSDLPAPLARQAGRNNGVSRSESKPAPGIPPKV